jgi:hypothetical protein
MKFTGGEVGGRVSNRGGRDARIHRRNPATPSSNIGHFCRFKLDQTSLV